MYEYECSHCKRKFNRKEEYAGHRARCSIPKEECPICKKKIDYVVFAKHCKSHQNEKRNCLNCNKEIDNRHKFCSCSCSASYYGKRRPHKEKIIVKRFCLFCGKQCLSKKSMFCSHTCCSKYAWDIEKTEIEQEQKVIAKRDERRYLLEKKGNICDVCKNSIWMDKPIALSVHHIDGDSRNSSLSNLSLLCWNCHAQTPTFMSKNRKIGRRQLRKLKAMEISGVCECKTHQQLQDRKARR